MTERTEVAVRLCNSAYAATRLRVEPPEAMPLLGQSFLVRIDKVAIERDRMTLTKL